MADIFISYASPDRDQVAPLAAALADRGWSVWWDRQIPPGKTFDEVIEEALDQATVVLAVWTEAGVASPWVRTEAAEGAARGILVPVAMEEVRIPLAFRRIQAADLIAWEPGQETAGFMELINALDELIGEQPTAEPQPAEPGDAVKDAVRAAQEMAGAGDWEGTARLLASLEHVTQGFADDYPEAVELLARSRRKQDAAELYEEAEVLYADGRWHDVVARFLRILELDPEIEFGTDLRSRAERHIEDEHIQRLEHNYQRAAEALKAREWPLAVARYEELLAEAPDRKDAVAQLDLARAGAATDRHYRTLQEMFARERWDGVIAGMADLAKANPDFGDPEALLARARARLSEQEGKSAAGDNRDAAHERLAARQRTVTSNRSQPVRRRADRGCLGRCSFLSAIW